MQAATYDWTGSKVNDVVRAVMHGSWQIWSQPPSLRQEITSSHHHKMRSALRCDHIMSHEALPPTVHSKVWATNYRSLQLLPFRRGLPPKACLHIKFDKEMTGTGCVSNRHARNDPANSSMRQLSRQARRCSCNHTSATDDHCAAPRLRTMLESFASSCRSASDAPSK